MSRPMSRQAPLWNPTALSDADPAPDASGLAIVAPSVPSTSSTQADGGEILRVDQPAAQVSASLRAEFQTLLHAGVHGLCFSPYLEGQAPGTEVSETQIRERLQIIAPHTRWVRSFSCTEGHEITPRVAHELGMKTLVGA